MKNIFFLLLLFVSTFTWAQQVKETYKKARITYSGRAEISRLADMGIPMDHGEHKVGHYITGEFSESELEMARNNGFRVDVYIEDLTAHFLEQNTNPTPRISRNESCSAAGETFYETPDNFELGSMGGYLTYQEVLNNLDAMRAQYPNLITAPSNISNFLTEGQPDNSVTPSIGGNGIKWMKISDNPDANNEGEPQILYSSIHHAREPVSLSQLIFYMWYLLENYDTDPEVKSIVDNTELYFVPVVNPDGYLYNQVTDPNGGGFWRKNRKNGHGVDNNRNYNFFVGGDPNNGVWSGPGSSGNTDGQTYHGPSPFSEVENQAMKWFVENHEFVMAFNNHTSGELLYFPHAYADVPTPDEELFIGISGELVSQNGFTNLRDSPFSGDSDDFMYGTVGTHEKILAFTPEIGPSFWPPSNQIENLCRTMMYLNLTAAKMVNNYASVVDTAPQFTGGTDEGNATFDIRRLGVSGSGNFTVSINPVSDNMFNIGAPLTYNDLETLESDSGSIPYFIAGGTTSGDDIIYDLVVNNGAYDTSVRVNKKFGSLETIFEDEGDSVTANFDNNGWATTSSTFVSPSNSITDSPNGNYNNNTNKSITLSDEIDLTDALGANVTFFAKWEIENNFDYTQFEVSTNGGTTWTAQCGKYTNPGSNNDFQPTGEPLYDGTQNDWVQEEIDLSDYLGETILVRFTLLSDGFQSADGFFFDDLKFNVVEEVTLNNEDNSVNEFVVYPNPVQDALNINSALDNYTYELFSIQGQSLSRKENNNGSQTIDYSTLATGIYLLKLTSNNSSQTLRIVKK